MSGVILNYFYAVGEASIALIAWLSKNWVTVQMTVSVPPMLFVLYYWLIPESVRWLLANHENKKASRIIQKAAKVNKAQLSRELIHSIENEGAEKESLDVKESAPSLWTTFKKLLHSKSLVFRSVLLFYIWAANAFVYYGLSVNSTSLGGNKYINFALVCLVEIPGYTIAWWAMNKLGRRWSLAGSLLLCSATCIAAAFTPQDIHIAVIALFLLGKLGITASFGIAYVYTAEVYPTIMRSIGVGASSTTARLGALVAPFAPLLGTYSKPLPLILFSGVSLAAGVFTLFLPETLGTKLPDTVEEAEKLKLIKLFSSWRKEVQC
ncbi:UNVERIFIED_CONTAM: hypothetical protein PYX00_003949 [Menopon gallinae]|uniref:Major facilitator superfamily (MFS) profile domain-containing protein n=1 Tax=Menopon gallinae TaxID=328185 RepID=A0AAW2I2E9_9NEOP